MKNSKYNLRQDECKAAAYALMGYAGMDYDTFANTRLRDVPFEVFEAIPDASMVLLQGKTISKGRYEAEKNAVIISLEKMNGNVRKDGKIWNTGVALLKYFAGLNSNQNGQYGQIYAEKFTSACLICKVFYGKMKAQ